MALVQTLMSTAGSRSPGVGITDGQIITLASGALLTIGLDGTFDYDPNGQFEALAAGAAGSDSFTYTIDDGAGGTDTGAVSLTIDGRE